MASLTSRTVKTGMEIPFSVMSKKDSDFPIIEIDDNPDKRKTSFIVSFSNESIDISSKTIGSATKYHSKATGKDVILAQGRNYDLYLVLI